MKILYINAHGFTDTDVIETFENIGISYGQFFEDIKKLFAGDDEARQKITEKVKNEGFDVIFSTYYFPMLSRVSADCGVQYIAWSYDCPIHYDDLGLLTNPATKLFQFDKAECKGLKRSESDAHIYHLPLAVNCRKYDECINREENDRPELDGAEISFVGNLYKEKDWLPELFLLMSDYGRGFTEAVRNSVLYNYSFDPTDAFNEQIMKAISTEALASKISEYYEITGEINGVVPQNLLREQVLLDASYIERRDIIRTLSESFELRLFSNEWDDSFSNVIKCGPVSYSREMPFVFRNSKINLNITCRLIQSGIPQRCLDIMASGGFLLSNRQSELVEYFNEGEEAEFFSSREEALDKCRYYIAHDEIRSRIAAAGHEKVKREFDFPSRIRYMLGI